MALTSLLVANRAEIAVRVLDSAAVLGLRTVAVHPADDATCAHVARADAAHLLPGEGVAAYLDIDALLAAAAEHGCDAIHPGYGFLSENPAFAAACAAAGVTFVGPDARALALFGDKGAPRRRAGELGIPLLAATDGATTPAQAAAFLEDLGPGGAVMIKAIAGGGGRGMAPVTDPAALAAAFARCAAEATQAVGDGSLYVEELLRGARHVEVQ